MTLACELPGASLASPHAKFPDPPENLEETGTTASIVLAGGCFWCTEAVYRQLDGVTGVTSGYAGDTEAKANYEVVCSGRTNHAEAIRIDYDPSRISLGRILKVFFSAAHDPTQLDRQGNDHGRQYRSAIFYANDDQKRVAKAYIAALNQAGAFRSPVVTTLEPLEKFHPAETYHQDYARRNPGQPYIAGVSMPKVEKVRAYFPENLRRPG